MCVAKCETIISINNIILNLIYYKRFVCIIYKKVLNC